jgi:hypothetical protein
MRTVLWKCSCGEMLDMVVEDQATAGKQCPVCGLTSSPKEEDPGPAVSDEVTQRLDLGEMARLAQQGVGPGEMSGEWDTSTFKRKGE